jgi:hypothetical protein
MLQTKDLTRVVLTLSYSAIFNFPLTEKEVWLRLVGRGLSLSCVANLLNQLKLNKVVSSHQAYWTLIDRDMDQLVKQRQKRRQQALEKLTEIKPLVRLLKHLPWVRGVAVTGSVAVKNARKHDDVDLLIITTLHGLWLTRLIVTGLAWVKGKRRSFAKEEENSWCFNLWLTETNLVLPSKKRSLYTAYDLLQTRWLLDKDGLEFRFVSLNAWARRYLENYYKQRYFISHSQSCQVVRMVVEVLDWFVSPINVLAYLFQRLYMQRHLTNELVGYSLAFFHPRNTKNIIYKRWKKLLLSLKG